MSKRTFHVHWSDKALKRLHNPFIDVPINGLNNYELELRQLISATSVELARLNQLHGLVLEAQRRKDDEQSVVITDHAIVRYLERYENFDLTKVENAILAMARDQRPEVAVRDRTIVTVLPPGCETNDDDR